MKQIIFGLTCLVMVFGFSLTASATIGVPDPLPTTAEECKQYGWEAYLVFKNQGDCVSFISTDGKNEPALLVE